MNNLKEWLKKCEGFRGFPYRDTVGKLTIGYGRNLDDLGITEAEADLMLDNNIKECKALLSAFFWYYSQEPAVQDALVNMCFNLGLKGLLGFKKMIYYLNEHNMPRAALEALDSKWAKQVGKRATDIALIIREGSYAETGADRPY